MAEEPIGTRATPEQQAEMDRVVAEHAAAVAELNELALFEARLAALPGEKSVHISKGWVRHPDWRGPLTGPRRRQR